MRIRFFYGLLNFRTLCVELLRPQGVISWHRFCGVSDLFSLSAFGNGVIKGS